jgi:exodeoxyribonuclease VII small subunit
MTTKQTPPTYAALQAELDDIIAWFESSDFDLETANAKYARGLELIASIEKLLAHTKVMVVKLQTKLSE